MKPTRPLLTALLLVPLAALMDSQRLETVLVQDTKRWN